jgi:hypothetical protein
MLISFVDLAGGLGVNHSMGAQSALRVNSFHQTAQNTNAINSEKNNRISPAAKPNASYFRE